jgi:hypothetical protein
MVGQSPTTLRVAHRLALALGQEETILDKVEHGELHPAMAAFGLWRNELDLSTLSEEINGERLNGPTRPKID